MSIYQLCLSCGLHTSEAGRTCELCLTQKAHDRIRNLEEVLGALLLVSREYANDYELGSQNYQYWADKAKALLDESD